MGCGALTTSAGAGEGGGETTIDGGGATVGVGGCGGVVGRGGAHASMHNAMAASLRGPSGRDMQLGKIAAAVPRHGT